MADIFDIVADSNRRDILGVLLDAQAADPDGEISVSQIVADLELSQPTVSKHLKVLRDAHLVVVREQGQRRLYHLDAAPLESVQQWLGRFLPPEPEPVEADATAQAATAPADAAGSGDAAAQAATAPADAAGSGDAAAQAATAPADAAGPSAPAAGPSAPAAGPSAPAAGPSAPAAGAPESSAPAAASAAPETPGLGAATAELARTLGRALADARSRIAGVR